MKMPKVNVDVTEAITLSIEIEKATASKLFLKKI